jgi:hypothetical protein
MDESTKYNELNKEFLLKVFEKLSEEIQKSKTDSKGHHLQRLAISLMKIGTKSQQKGLIERGEEELLKLSLWEKAEGYRMIADYLTTQKTSETNANEYYKKSYTHWQDTLLNKKEPIMNLIGPGTKLIKSLKKNDKRELLMQVAKDYPKFLVQLTDSQQSIQWLEHAVLMEDILPPSELTQIMHKAEILIHSNSVRAKQQFSMNRFMLEYEIAKASKDLEKIEELFKEIQERENDQEISTRGIIQSVGVFYGRGAQMHHQSIMFAEAFFEAKLPERALKILNSRVEELLSRWEKNEEGGWALGSAEKSLILNELLAHGNVYVNHDYKEECEKLKPILTDTTVDVQEIQPFGRTNFLLRLGWYTEEKIEEQVTQIIKQLQQLVSKLKEDSLDKRQSKILGMQLAQKSIELSMYKAAAEKMGVQTILVQIDAFEKEMKTVQTAEEEKPEGNILHTIATLIKEKKYKESFPLIAEHESQIREKFPNMPPPMKLYQKEALIRLYISGQDYENAKRILQELEDSDTAEEEPKSPTLPQTPTPYGHLPENFLKNRQLFSRLALKIQLGAKLGELNFQDILAEVPLDNTDFMYQLGGEFTKNREIEFAKKILSMTHAVDTPVKQKSKTTYKYHLLRGRIHLAIGDERAAKKEAELAYTCEKRPYELIMSLNENLELYFELGDQKKCKELLEEMLQNLHTAPMFQLGMQFPLPKFLFEIHINQETDPQKYTLLEELQTSYREHVREYYTETVKSGQNPMNFSGIITFIKTLMKLELREEAQELTWILLKTLEELIKERNPKFYTESLLISEPMENLTLWDIRLLGSKLSSDPVTIPSNMNITELMTTSPLSPMASPEEKKHIIISQHGQAYAKLAELFVLVAQQPLVKLCETNSKKLLEIMDLEEQSRQSLNMFREYEINLRSQNYSLAKQQLHTLIQSLDGSKIRSWEQFFPYVRLFQLIVEKRKPRVRYQ